MIKILRSRRGEGYIDTLVSILVVMMLISLIINVVPVFVAKQQLNLFAQEIVREAEITGRIGGDVNQRIQEMREQTSMNPSIHWETSYYSGDTIQLNTPIKVTVTHSFTLGGFGGITSFPVTLSGKATGRSEVYYK